MKRKKSKFRLRPIKLFKFNGFRCFILKHQELNVLCGYVYVNAPDHLDLMSNQEIRIHCHGGITYHKRNKIGFDCGHAGDFIPFTPEICKHFQGGNPTIYGTYRNEAYVENQLKNIAAQLVLYGFKTPHY